MGAPRACCALPRRKAGACASGGAHGRVFDVMRRCKLEPKRAQLVQPSATKPANCCLLKGVRGGKPRFVGEPVVPGNPDGNYT